MRSILFATTLIFSCSANPLVPDTGEQPPPVHIIQEIAQVPQDFHQRPLMERISFAIDYTIEHMDELHPLNQPDAGWRLLGMTLGIGVTSAAMFYYKLPELFAFSNLVAGCLGFAYGDRLRAALC